MSRPFAKYNASSAFSKPKNITDSSEYISKKKIKNSFCTPNICYPNKNIGSSSNYISLKKANTYAYDQHDSFNKTQLYSNLYTKLQLNEYVIPIIDLSGNYPVLVNSNIPYTNYIIDPCGNLFGDNLCGITNFQNYIEYNNL